MSGPRRTTPRSRRRLDAGAIVAVALGLVRVEGLAAVTMRRVADELEVAPMSLYRHVADRQTLLIAMLDRVARSIAPPPPQPTARAEVAAVLQAIHDSLSRDPWVVELLTSAGLTGPSILPLVERSYAGLHAAGLEPLDARRAFTALIEFTYGEVLVSHHQHPETYSRRLTLAVDPDRFPHLTAVARDVTPRDPSELHHYAEILERMLDVLLPGRSGAMSAETE